MTKLETFWDKYKVAVATGATMLLLGFLGGQVVKYGSLPTKVQELDNKLKKFEEDKAIKDADQDKKIEIITNIVQTNQTQYAEIKQSIINLNDNFNKFFNRYERFEDGYYQRVPRQ